MVKLLFWCLALLCAGCFLPDIDLSGRQCDDAHACVRGWVCVEGTCEQCADRDSDGELPTFCGGNDCDDTNNAVKPGATEVCDDGLDNDCNGDEDGADEVCRCEPGETLACGNECFGAVRLCVDGSFGACTPPAEICNGEDEDCDGDADDGFACVLGATRPCTTACGAEGVETCGEDCGWGACEGLELCNGEDDDCDEVIDDGFECVASSSEACTTSCGSEGVSSCDATSCTKSACVPPEELCNGFDEDCDGRADDTFFCAKGEGAPSTTCTTTCGTEGRIACNDTCSAYDGACLAPAEICDGLDQDCDEVADQGLTSSRAQLGSGSSALAVAVASRGEVTAVARAETGAVNVDVWKDGRVVAQSLRVSGPESQPAALAVEVGSEAVLVAWVDKAATPPRLTIAAVSIATGAVTHEADGLAQADGDTRPIIAWSPVSPGACGGAGQPLCRAFVVSWTQTRLDTDGLPAPGAMWVELTEGGAAVRSVHRLEPFDADARTVGIAPVPGSDEFAMAFALPSGATVVAQIAKLSVDGALAPWLYLPGSARGAPAKEGIELASDGTRLWAAWVAPRTEGGSDRAPHLTMWIPGESPIAPIVPDSETVVAKSLRLGVGPLGTMLSWIDQPSAPTLRAALLRDETWRYLDLDDGAGASPKPGSVTFDGTSWRAGWVTGGSVFTRTVCP